MTLMQVLGALIRFTFMRLKKSHFFAVLAALIVVASFAFSLSSLLGQSGSRISENASEYGAAQNALVVYDGYAKIPTAIQASYKNLQSQLNQVAGVLADDQMENGSSFSQLDLSLRQTQLKQFAYRHHIPVKDSLSYPQVQARMAQDRYYLSRGRNENSHIRTLADVLSSWTGLLLTVFSLFCAIIAVAVSAISDTQKSTFKGLPIKNRHYAAANFLTTAAITLSSLVISSLLVGLFALLLGARPTISKIVFLSFGRFQAVNFWLLFVMILVTSLVLSLLFSLLGRIIEQFTTVNYFFGIGLGLLFSLPANIFGLLSLLNPQQILSGDAAFVTGLHMNLLPIYYLILLVLIIASYLAMTLLADHKKGGLLS
ncbi:hypothetical protein OKIT_0072 [Oenococcus kitaharae DSM 17330]|uniref:Uncharacterized protein n=3 Tax=Oenococcus kitaharae TaxID=336988 RepID=G9WIR2_9LACO|nr:hypothetical protein OKIT_0072 [Oenococcus kitaharae DSM 17330]